MLTMTAQNVSALRKKLGAHLDAGGSVVAFANMHKVKRAAVHYQATKLGYAKFFLSPQEQAWLAKMPRGKDGKTGLPSA